VARNLACRVCFYSFVGLRDDVSLESSKVGQYMAEFDLVEFSGTTGKIRGKILV
jgi:hypothetical protein